MRRYKVAYRKPLRKIGYMTALSGTYDEDEMSVSFEWPDNGVLIYEDLERARATFSFLQMAREVLSLPYDLMRNGRYVFAVYNVKKRQALTSPDA